MRLNSKFFQAMMVFAMGLILSHQAALAGGIGFSKDLIGKNPFNDREIIFKGDGGLGEDGAEMHMTFNEVPGVLKQINRTNSEFGETILEIQVGADKLRAVLSNDCQMVERMLLIYPSGAQVLLKAAQN